MATKGKQTSIKKECQSYNKDGKIDPTLHPEYELVMQGHTVRNSDYNNAYVIFNW